MAVFVTSAAATAATEDVESIDGSDTDLVAVEPAVTLLGWPLALAVATAAATLWGLHRARRAG